MYILGISAGMHDSSAALIKNGKIIAFAEEERFTREKHTGKIPINSIKFLLNYAGISPEHISAIGFFWKPFKGILRRIAIALKWSQNIFKLFNKNQPSYLYTMLKIPYVLKKEFGFNCPFYYLDHYSCHIASVTLTSPFDSSAFLIADGNGEIDTICGGIFEENNHSVIIKNYFPNSIGLVYMSITEYLGFKGNSDEGKTMGLAPFGSSKYIQEFKKIISINGDGKIKIDLKYFDYHYSKEEFVTPLFEKHFGTRRKKGEEIKQHHKDVAFALQAITEEVLIHIIDKITKETLYERFSFGGGIFLNSVANDKIRRYLSGAELYIPPWVSDAGTSIGAALILSQKLDREFKKHHQFSPYLGPEYSEREIENALSQSGLKFEKSSNIYNEIAKRIAQGEIIGWFQGRMEAGPRALGNRSILADPRRKDMKDILNKKVKHREDFRPFAPAVLLEKAQEYFEINIESPYMLFACPVKPEKVELIPAVIHIDNTARIQTVSLSSNERFYRLISEFEKLTGIPIVLNTSFNVAGEPIVCSPDDAIKCFLNTEVDCLAIGDFIVDKKGNKRC